MLHFVSVSQCQVKLRENEMTAIQPQNYFMLLNIHFSDIYREAFNECLFKKIAKFFRCCRYEQSNVDMLNQANGAKLWVVRSSVPKSSRQQLQM